MNKQPFDNAGVAQVQSGVLALPTAEKLQELNEIRADLFGWMDKCFLLTPSQKEQLAALPTAFRQDIAFDVADSWEEGILIAFNKEEEEEDDDRGLKDLIYERKRSQSYRFPDEQQTTTQQVSIWIRYHS